MSSEPVKMKKSAKILTRNALAINTIIRGQLMRLREAFYVDPSLSKTEARNVQRAVLAEYMQATPAAVAAIEVGDCVIPACYILALAAHFSLPCSYFFDANAPLPQQFIAVQEQLRLKEEINYLKLLTQQHHRAVQSGLAPRTKKGGWLKGLPRRPKTDEQIALVSIWHIAKKQGKVFSTPEELVRWAKSQNLSEAAMLPEHFDEYKLRNDNKARNARATRSQAALRKKGGWLKGVPRHPTTAHEQEIKTAWELSRTEHLQFESVVQMMEWWNNRPQ